MVAQQNGEPELARHSGTWAGLELAEAWMTDRISPSAEGAEDGQPDATWRSRVGAEVLLSSEEDMPLLHDSIVSRAAAV